MARGRSGSTDRSGLPLGRILAIAAGVTTTIVAWGLLVFAAIDFGREARAGSGADWAFLGVATVGAVACMFLAIVLASRLQSELRTERPPRAPRPARPSVTPTPAALPASAPTPITPPAAPQTRVTPGRHRS